MNQEQRLTAIEQLLPYLKQYRSTGYAKIDGDAIQILKEVYTDIYLINSLSLSCSSCVSHYLEMLAAFYEREKPIFDSNK